MAVEAPEGRTHSVGDGLHLGLLARRCAALGKRK